MNVDLLNLDSASCPRPSGRQVLAASILCRCVKIHGSSGVWPIEFIHL